MESLNPRNGEFSLFEGLNRRLRGTGGGVCGEMDSSRKSSLESSSLSSSVISGMVFRCESWISSRSPSGVSELDSSAKI